MGFATTELVTMLAPLVELEKQASSCASLEDYHALRRSYETTNTRVLTEIRTTLKEADLSLPELHELYYDILRNPAYANDPDTRANVTAILNEAFEGMAGWKR